MSAPLEKVCHLFGRRIRIKHIFEPGQLDAVDAEALYLIHSHAAPQDASHDKVMSELEEALPFSIPLQTPGWYFIQTHGRTWEEHLHTLKVRHAKKLRRYMRKPDKFGYRIEAMSPRNLTKKIFLHCHELLSETMAYNSDLDLYTPDSFARYLLSLQREFFVAIHNDGRVLGFYTGDVIGHDHSIEFRSWGVYHNLFIAFVRQQFAQRRAVIDLGNTNDSFKIELGGKSCNVVVELRCAASVRSGMLLAAWAFSTWFPEDGFVQVAWRLANEYRAWTLAACLVLFGILAAILCLHLH